MNVMCNSKFAVHIEAMIELRLALGRSPSSLLAVMQNFDRFCLQNHPLETVLTREIVIAWCADGKSAGGSGYKMHIIREFRKYLVSVGVNAFVFPAEWIGKQRAALPHIFTDAELQAFFTATDEILPCKNSHFREYTLPVIFRLQYGCGLRPQEVRLLKRYEINFNDGTVYIAQAKGNKDRKLAIDAHLTELCRKYDEIADIDVHDRKYFFQSPKRRPYTHGWLSSQFHRLRKLAGIPIELDDAVPYDFRHNFATRTLMKWVEEKRNLDVWLPYLSTYMGHATFSSTAYYIHLLPERLAKCDFTKLSRIIPEVSV